MKNQDISQEYLKSILRYSPRKGTFIWKEDRGTIKTGDLAGGARDKCRGYLAIRIDGKTYSSHRLAWLYMTGEWPKDMIDHINRSNNDNRWINLRECNNSKNLANREKPSNNISGYKGVYWHKNAHKWRAQAKLNYQSIHLGYFDCKHEAAIAYNKRTSELFGEFACLNEIKIHKDNLK